MLAELADDGFPERVDFDGLHLQQAVGDLCRAVRVNALFHQLLNHMLQVRFVFHVYVHDKFFLDRWACLLIAGLLCALFCFAREQDRLRMH